MKSVNETAFEDRLINFFDCKIYLLTETQRRVIFSGFQAKEII